MGSMVIMCGNELWKLNRSEIQMLEIFKRTVLRRICGGKKR